MDENEDYVIKVLESLNCHVVKIPESQIDGQSSPDFSVNLLNDQYVIELKTKNMSKNAYDAIYADIDTHGVCTNSVILERENRYSKVISKAKNQLKSYRIDDFSFKIIWLHSIGAHSYNHMEQFKQALYGIKILVDFDYEDGTRECYFFEQSDFYRYRNIIDGAILTRDGNLQFCLNPLSENFEKLKKSSLVTSLDNSNQLDPLQLAKIDKIYYADNDMPRGDNTASLDYLREKYGYSNLMIMPMESVSAHTILS